MINLSNSQKLATDTFKHFILDNTQNAMVISGSAGTGKSFLVRHLADVAEAELALIKTLDKGAPDINILYAATTNKAASVLHVLTGRSAETIHKILGLTVAIDYTQGTTSLQSKHGLPSLDNTILFIDEASMISADLLRILNEVLADAVNTKFVFIGDKYQLPPVKEKVCSVFKQALNHVELVEIQRQVKHNPVLQLAHKYRQMLDDPSIGFPEIVSNGGFIHHYTDHAKFKQKIAKSYSLPHSPDDLRTLAWTNKQVIAYNAFIRKTLNMPKRMYVGEYVIVNSPVLNTTRRVLLSTDSVHRIMNITTKEVAGVKGSEVEFHSANTRDGVVNIFHPHKWADKNKLLKHFAKTKDWTQYWAIKHGWADLRPIHASTVHKSQGSTYREVFVDLEDIGRNNKWDEVAKLAYVAITRASDIVHIYGDITKNYNRISVQQRMQEFNHALL